MQYLWKTVWGVALIVVLEGVKKICDRIFVEATFFHHNFISCVQVTILLFLCITLVVESTVFKRYGSRRAKRYGLLTFVLVFTAVELTFSYWFHNPRQVPRVALQYFVYYYNNFERNILQYDKDHANYDSSLFYVLKPSSRFLFRNIEFSDSFFVNRMGLRDDDMSLLKPDIICLGDSYAMGWGVSQNQAFASQLETLTGKKVLNAAMSSYGTARELKSLYRFDTSNLQYIIIQYCRNDIVENKEFVSNDYSLPISSRKEYDSLTKVHSWSKLYFPGKYFLTIGKIYTSSKLADWREERMRKNAPAADSSETKTLETARYFMNILLHSKINFSNVKVLVLDLNELEFLNNRFIDEVKRLSKISPYKEHVHGNLVTVPVADILSKQDYYILDAHPHASGHHKIAERLYRVILNNSHKDTKPEKILEN